MLNAITSLRKRVDMGKNDEVIIKCEVLKETISDSGMDKHIGFGLKVFYADHGEVKNLLISDITLNETEMAELCDAINRDSICLFQLFEILEDIVTDECSSLYV